MQRTQIIKLWLRLNAVAEACNIPPQSTSFAVSAPVLASFLIVRPDKTIWYVKNFHPMEVFFSTDIYLQALEFFKGYPPTKVYEYVVRLEPAAKKG